MKKFLLLLLLLLSSCHTQYVPLPEVHTRDSTHYSIYTRADSIREYVSDSMSIRMVSGAAGISGTAGPSPDTVYVDRWHTVYKDRWHFRDRTDTLTVTQHDTITVPVPVEPPPRKSLALSERIRVLWKGCLLGGLAAILLSVILYIFLRLAFKR